jgi:hypothetical protein
MFMHAHGAWACTLQTVACTPIRSTLLCSLFLLSFNKLVVRERLLLLVGPLAERVGQTRNPGLPPPRKRGLFDGRARRALVFRPRSARPFPSYTSVSAVLAQTLRHSNSHGLFSASYLLARQDVLISSI